MPESTLSSSSSISKNAVAVTETASRPVNIGRDGKPLPEPQPGDLIIIDGPRLAQVISRDDEAIVYAELSDCSSGKPLDTSKRYGHGSYDNVDIVPPLPITTPQAAALYVGDIAKDKDGDVVRIGDTIALTDGSHLGGVVVAVADAVVVFRRIDNHHDVTQGDDFVIIGRAQQHASPSVGTASNQVNARLKKWRLRGCEAPFEELLRYMDQMDRFSFGGEGEARMNEPNEVSLAQKIDHVRKLHRAMEHYQIFHSIFTWIVKEGVPNMTWTDSVTIHHVLAPLHVMESNLFELVRCADFSLGMERASEIEESMEVPEFIERR